MAYIDYIKNRLNAIRDEPLEIQIKPNTIPLALELSLSGYATEYKTIIYNLFHKQISKRGDCTVEINDRTVRYYT